MSNWLHYIGKSYYDIDTFIAEAQKYGITRRLPLSHIKGMSWGDIVTCVQKEGSNKSHSVFMEFTITRIAGLAQGTSEKLGKLLPMRQLDEEPEEVTRECGSYETAGTYEFDAPLSDVAQELYELDKKGADVGKLMIGCGPGDITLIPKPYPLVDLCIAQTQGFRPYNRDKFVGDVTARESAGKRVRLKGTYYLKQDPDKAAPGKAVEVKSYSKREDADPDFIIGGLHMTKKHKKNIRGKRKKAESQLMLL